tara:strand:- start:21 stop:254 length:234 start_codon:yes stop_codon:yes gene_type:complete
MFLISSTPTEIILIKNGCTLSSVQKDNVLDFTTRFIGNTGVIDFDTKSGKAVSFAFIGADFDNALIKLIEITDGMGI